MVTARDYFIDSDWDIDFTAWDDIREARDERVLIQNFVLLAQDVVGEYVGDNPTATDLQRIKNVLVSRYEQREYVDDATIIDLSLEDGEFSFTAIINSNEFSETLRVK